MTASPARHLLTAEPLTTEDVAKLLRSTAAPDGSFNPDVARLVQEFDRLRWELAGAIGARDYARAERNDLEGRYWRLQMTAVKGGKV